MEVSTKFLKRPFRPSVIPIVVPGEGEMAENAFKSFTLIMNFMQICHFRMQINA